MFFKSALLSTLLLAFAVLAHPTSPYEQPQPVERSHPTAPEISGAGFNTQSKGSVKSMSAEFTVPHITGGGTTSGVVGAMIDGIEEDGDQCFPILSGVQMMIGDDGSPVYQAVWQVGNGDFYAIDSYAHIYAGDRIKVTVEVNADRKSGVVTAVNLKHQRHPWKYYYTLSSPLCMQSGFWVVHTVPGPGPGLSLPNFGTVNMLVHADVAGKSVNARGAIVFDLQSGQARASISGDGKTVSVYQ